MKGLHRRLVLNKREDWRSCYCFAVVPRGEGLTLAPGVRGGAICLARIDSTEKGFVWGRLSLECELAQDSVIRVSAYASDSERVENGQTVEDYLSGLTPGTVEAAAALGELFRPAGTGEERELDESGRYLWLMIEFVAAGPPPLLKAVRLELCGDHMIDYLPAIYRKEGEFTRRFLSVFDSMFMDMEHSIYELPARFDYENASEEMLRYLAQWMCVDALDGPEQSLAERIRTAQADYESLYTVAGVKRSVFRLTGKEPLLIERADVDPNRPDCVDSALYRRLYGDDPYRFFLLLPEEAFSGRAQIEAFLTRMKQLIPAGMDFELILLKRCVQLDRHTYLGVNTMVSDYVPVVMDENSTIHYDTMIGGDEGERN